MEQEEFCKDCHLKHDCQEVYRRLGNKECPPVLLKTITAFLLPMVVFTVSLAVFEEIFSAGSYLHVPKAQQSAICCLIAVLITAAAMIIVKFTNKLLRNLLRTFKI